MAKNESVSQQLEGIIDTGAENFSVDLLTVAESGELEENQTELSASEKEKSQDDDLIIDEDENIDDDDDLENKSETSADDDENDDSDKNDLNDEDDVIIDDDDDSDAKYSKRVRNRISNLSKKRRTAETNASLMQEENTLLKEKLKGLEDGKTSSDEKPDVEDFENEEDFIEALSNWKAEKKIDAQLSKDAEHAAEQEQQGVETETKKHMAAGKKKFKNFDATVKDLQLKRSILPVINGLKNTPDVLFYLGKNLDKADDINDLIDAGQSIKAGMLLQKISSSIKIKKRSSAPNPIRPGGGRSQGGVKDLGELSNADYRKARDKQEKEARKG